MTQTPQKRFRQATAALVALALVLSALGPVGTVAAAPTVTVAQSPNSTTVAPGDTVEIETELAITELNAPQLVSSLPADWMIESQSADGPVAFNGGAWTWLAGDGDGVDVTYTVTYTVAVPADASPGEYTVGAEGSALSPDGSRTADTVQTTVTVQETPANTAPTASITGPTAAQTGETLTFEASASDDGSIESYAWDLGDGTTASGESVSHAYASAGDYTVGLTVTDDDGAAATATQTVSVSEAPPANSAPTADAGVDQTVTAGDSVTLDASGSTDADGDSLTYAWTQTAGPSVTLSGADSATPSFAAPDVSEETAMAFEVSVADGDGAADTDSVSVTVEPDESDEPDAPDEPSNGTAPETTVSLSPESDLLAVNQTGAFDLVVDPAAGGVGAYSITVSLSESSVGTITGVELAGEGSLSDVQVAENGSSVTIEAVLVDTKDTGAVTLGTVSVQGVAEGETDLVLDVTTLGTEVGTPYEVTAVDGATLTVSTLVVGNSDAPANDVDGDGRHEDVNGDGVVDVLDVQTLFAARNGPTTTENPDAFDFNGDGTFDVLDVQWLYYNEVA